jgi:Protein of unknown function (DUF2806)
MGESDSHSLINLGDFSKPANTLIEKISDAVCGLAKPFQIRRVAEAEADADKIRAVSRIEITELERRAMSRLFAEEAKKQHNIEAITLKALPDVSPESKPEKMEDDWIANFFDKCRLISDEQMQSLWGRILAGEANSPGKFSKRTVNLVGNLDKSDAALFSTLCSFVFEIGVPTVLIFDFSHKIYNDAGIFFSGVDHLESAGLLHENAASGYMRKGLSQKGFVHYFGSPVWIKFPQEQKEGYQLQIGKVLFTQAGLQLAPLSGAQPREGFVDYVKEQWKNFGLTTEQQTEQGTVQSATEEKKA